MPAHPLPALALLSCGLVQSPESRKVPVAVLVRSADAAAGGVAVSGVTTAQVFFGDRQDLTSGQAPAGMAGHLHLHGHLRRRDLHRHGRRSFARRQELARPGPAPTS